MVGRVVVILLLLCGCGGAYADMSGIPPVYRDIAAQNRVPAKIFFALILNESQASVTVGGRKKMLPWPWTINHRGNPYYFKTKADAVQFASRLIARGDLRFDVGLGQLHWYYHKDKFNGDIRLAFHPHKNLSVAAAFLREQYDRPECNEWGTAVGCYHRPGQRSSDKVIAERYRLRVAKLWASI